MAVPLPVPEEPTEPSPTRSRSRKGRHRRTNSRSGAMFSSPLKSPTKEALHDELEEKCAAIHQRDGVHFTPSSLKTVSGGNQIYRRSLDEVQNARNLNDVCFGCDGGCSDTMCSSKRSSRNSADVESNCTSPCPSPKARVHKYGSSHAPAPKNTSPKHEQEPSPAKQGSNSSPKLTPEEEDCTNRNNLPSISSDTNPADLQNGNGMTDSIMIDSLDSINFDSLSPPRSPRKSPRLQRSGSGSRRNKRRRNSLLVQGEHPNNNDQSGDAGSESEKDDDEPAKLNKAKCEPHADWSGGEEAGASEGEDEVDCKPPPR